MTQQNGLETIELGSTAWRQVINYNLEQLDSNRIFSIESSALPTSIFKAKRFFYTNDTHKLYYDNGLALVELIGGSGSGSGAVDSVNTKTGEVVLTTEDIEEINNLYYTDARVQAYLDANNIGAIESVNGKTGIVVLNADDIANGTNNKYLNKNNLNIMLPTLGVLDVTKLGEFIGTNYPNEDLPIISSILNLGYLTSQRTLHDLSIYDLDYKNINSYYYNLANAIKTISDKRFDYNLNSLERIDCGTF